MRRAELPGQVQLSRHPVDGDDRVRAGDACALNDTEAHAAAADDRDRVRGADLRGVQRRPTPVVTPQPIRHSSSSGSAGSTATT